MNPIKKFFRLLGPGFVTGAADDDPSGIATYSQTGAQFGLGLLWLALFILPFQIAIQESCARIGAVTGTGIAANIKQHYNKPLLFMVVLLILVANIINICADIGAMAAAQLIIPGNFLLLTVGFTLLVLVLEIFIPYKTYANILKWFSLTLLAYPLTLFMIDAPWGDLVQATLIPQFELNYRFLFIVTAVVGTTISPYLFFWEASQTVEEVRTAKMIGRDGKTHLNAHYLRKLRLDNFLGMVFSQLGSWSMIAVAAVVLHSHGVIEIKTAADAAKALEPFVQSFPNAGYLAKLIFAIGIIGLGLVAVPVLAGSAAYAICEAFSWRAGLNLKPKKALGFYGIISVATLLGLCINFVGIDPIQALVYAAVINGVIAAPLILVLFFITRNKTIMGKYRSSICSSCLLLISFIVMTIAAVAMLLATR